MARGGESNSSDELTPQHEPSSMPPPRPRALLEALVRHEVRFIILGGIAERLLGSPRLTPDLDICPETSRANLRRLAAMLNEVEATWLREGMDETGFPIVEPWSARSFSSHTSLSLHTPFGKFDIWLRPDGTEGYSDLIRKAVDFDIQGHLMKIVHIDDDIRIKRKIGGVKYLSHLPLLRELQAERRAQGLD